MCNVHKASSLSDFLSYSSYKQLFLMNNWEAAPGEAESPLF